jgi:peroxiredoxin/GNAT superfamily N-acetyltransferase
MVQLREVSAARWVLFVYPTTGVPGEDMPRGWDEIPGARGCTAEACGFRDHIAELRTAGAARVLGLSVQTSAYQREFARRLRLPYPLLSDVRRALGRELGLPTFEAGEETFYRRLTLVVRGSEIEHVFFPVFPPETHAPRVAQWLRGEPGATGEATVSSAHEPLIRLAVPADRAGIARVLQEAFAEYRAAYTEAAFRATTPDPRTLRGRWSEGPVWVGLLEDRVVGTLAALPKGPALYLRSMAVAPAGRGEGLGWQLLQRAEQYAIKRGFERLTLFTTPFLHHAIRLYEGFGFQRGDDGPHELYGTPLLTLTKRLPSNSPAAG